MRLLVTNDDGIRAPGLTHLARALRDAGHDLTIAAPLHEASGAGAGVGPVHTMSDGIVVEPVSLPGLEDVPSFGVDALPALIVIAGCLGAFGSAPDVIASGVNPGRNVGRAALHSGTVGAALTAVHFNKRGLAMSIQSGRFSGFESAGPAPIHFETATAMAVALLPFVAAGPPRTVINCNVPNLALDELKGIRRAPLARSGLVRSAVVDERGGMRMQLELGFAAPESDDETDEALSTRGFVTVTPLASVSEDQRPEAAATVTAAIGSIFDTLGVGPDAAREVVDGPAA